METILILNEQKAKEIAQSVSFFWTNEEDDEKSIIDAVSLRKAIFNAVFQAMQWKDEQHAKEKQQLIDKACEWIKDHATYYAHWEWNGDTYEKEVVFDSEECAEAFEQFAKEEL